MTEYIVLLWLADLASHVEFLGAICFLAVLFGVLLVALFCAAEDANLFPRFKWWFLACAVIAILAGLAPSKKTIYAIIVMKAGHDIAQTELGTKAHEAMNALLDKVIAEAKK